MAIVCISHSVARSCSSHHLLPSFRSPVRWGCAVPARISTGHSRHPIDGGVLGQPPPPLVVGFLRLIGLRRASPHLHSSFASGV